MSLKFDVKRGHAGSGPERQVGFMPLQPFFEGNAICLEYSYRLHFLR